MIDGAHNLPAIEATHSKKHDGRIGKETERCYLVRSLERWSTDAWKIAEALFPMWTSS